MDPNELEEFRKIFDFIDTTNRNALRLWFEDYPELTTAERALIAQKSKMTIRRWRQKCKANEIIYVELDDSIVLASRRPPEFRMEQKKLLQIEIPKHWEQDPNWIAGQVAKGHSCRQLARLLKCSRCKITSILSKTKPQRPIPKSILGLLNG